MEHNTLALICFGAWFAFMILGSLGLFYWACFGKMSKVTSNFEWWKE